nr:lytic murein transglycosylase [Turicimonas muris]
MFRRPILLAGVVSLSVFSGLALAQSMSSTSAEKAMRYSERPDVKKFIADVSRRRGLDSEWMAEVLDQATYQPKIERLMTPKKFKPGTRDSRRDWEKYRAIFLGRDRLNLGARFWKENRATLERAKKNSEWIQRLSLGLLGLKPATVKTQDPGRFWTPLLP